MSVGLPLPALAELLVSLRAHGASDLFLLEGRVPQMRVDGALRPAPGHGPTTRFELDAFLALALTPAQREAFATDGDLDFGWSAPDGARLRCNLSRQQGRPALVARPVPSGALAPASLGIPAEAVEFAGLSRGLVLITGSTGSGKSTTLAALVHHINETRAAHVVCVEDPIEFVHTDLRSRVVQREVGADTRSWSRALRQVLRQSPDVIVIGELRDAEAMEVAIQAAMTGHLVLASLHTTDAVQTVQRLLTAFPEGRRLEVAHDLSLCLRGVLSQRLVPRTAGGRALVCELLTVTPAVARLLREQRTDDLSDLLRTLAGPGLRSFTASLLQLHRAGEVSYEAALAASTQPEEFALAARGMRTGTARLTPDEGLADEGLDMRRLLRAVDHYRASDLHLAVGRPPILRISGVLEPLGDRVLTDADLRTLLLSILSARQRTTYELEREIDFALAVDDGRRFRVNAYFQQGRMAAAFRAIPSVVPRPGDLGIPETLLELGTRPQGLLLVVGPTGAGKSTTLACLVDRINRTRSCRILTVEDPIEYVHASVMATIDQREVGADTGSFSSALRYVLRQDPDVILVGEMRDLETISAAITAAETGHLVLATLHSNDAVQAVDRMIDVFPSHQQAQIRAQLAGALLGVVSQRLLVRRDGTGRVGAFEVLVATSAIRALIRDAKLHQARSIMEGARRDGMITMDHSVRELFEAGRITYDEALRYLTNPRLIPAPIGGAAPAAPSQPAPPSAPPPAAAPTPAKKGFWG